jgi:hypothetical protein
MEDRQPDACRPEVRRARQAARDVLRRIYDNRLEARLLRRTVKPSAPAADRVGDLISSIRKHRDRSATNAK